MAKQSIWLFFTIIVFSTMLVFQALAHTDELDVVALQDLFKALNSPFQLKGWKSDGGDPCEEGWMGISCSGSSVIHIILNELNLSGNLGFNLSNLQSLKQLDLSSNNIQGPIPYALPLNVTYLNLSGNNLSRSIPNSLTSMTKLRHLNLSHNALSGSIGDVFNGLDNLREMDLSFNNFIGDLPISFGYLKNLSKLFLQSNQFTGAINFLSDLPLSDLNIEDNQFTGVIPEKFQNIRNLWIGGNRFNIPANYTPWNFPTDVLPNERNITRPPTTESNAVLSYPYHDKQRHKKQGPSGGETVFMICGIMVATFAGVFIAIRVHRLRKQFLRGSEHSESSTRSLPISTFRDNSSTSMEVSPLGSLISSSPRIPPWHLPPIRTRPMKVSERKSFSTKCKIPIRAKLYTVAELQLATDSFSEENLIGEGSLGSVYRGEFPDGQIYAVKYISTVQLSLSEEEQVLDVIGTASQLKHPSIVRLRGYCVDHDQHLLVYEYIKNVSLDDALHSALYKPLSWGLRLKIALSVARALDYLHNCKPPVTHGNLKAANVLLDEDLFPRLCDCGISILRPLTSNSVKLKASEMAIADSGYIAPEHIQPRPNSPMTDVYAFGVLLLELFTGRRPFDSSKEKQERILVHWASSRLHDSESLAEMVDPEIKSKISSKALSNFADIVSLCIQPVKEYRPPMSDIVESLKNLLEKPGVVKNNEDSLPFDRSFRSSNSRFFSSPTLSYYSI